MSSSTNSSGAFIQLFIWLVVIIFFMTRGCMSNPEEAVEHVESFGFTEVEVQEHNYMFVAFRGCGADAALFKLTAKNMKNESVKLSICAGWPFKGTTIRGNW